MNSVNQKEEVWLFWTTNPLFQRLTLHHPTGMLFIKPIYNVHMIVTCISYFYNKFEIFSWCSKANKWISSLETLWIGLSREQNKDWSWINGDQPNISHWKYEPNQYDTSQKCASVALKSPYWWYEGFCHEAKPFICQFREGKLPWRYKLFFILIKIDIFKVLLITLSFFFTLRYLQISEGSCIGDCISQQTRFG